MSRAQPLNARNVAAMKINHEKLIKVVRQRLEWRQTVGEMYIRNRTMNRRKINKLAKLHKCLQHVQGFDYSLLGISNL